MQQGYERDRTQNFVSQIMAHVEEVMADPADRSGGPSSLPATGSAEEAVAAEQPSPHLQLAPVTFVPDPAPHHSVLPKLSELRLPISHYRWRDCDYINGQVLGFGDRLHQGQAGS